MEEKETAMAKKRAATENKEITLDFGTVSDKQKQFLEADSFFVCYGGARGGGKSHVIRLKAVGMALKYKGIRILMVRCHYPELQENLIRPILRWLPQEIYGYNDTSHLLTFDNGSIIKFGHYDGDQAENEYQGTEYDIIFLDEATQLSERAFKYLQTCIRGVNSFPKRMYLSCNPGGIGHRWVKRLFIDRDYMTYPGEPERDEHPEDYTFIPATIDDNKWLLESSPMYLKNLANMPDDLRRAHRYGDWNALSGSYFKNFSTISHVVPDFAIPERWPRYRSFDYGLDMFAVCWWAVDEDGRSWCYRYFEEKNLVVQDAAKKLIAHTMPGEKILTTYAPPDMWARQKDSGRTIAELFLLNGVSIVRSDNNRVQGHMVMKDMMSDIALRDPYARRVLGATEEKAYLPKLMFFKSCDRIISDISDIQADDKNPNDCAKQPHSVTHSVDSARYYCVSRVLAAEAERIKAEIVDEDDSGKESYDEFMCGGDASDDYMAY